MLCLLRTSLRNRARTPPSLLVAGSASNAIRPCIAANGGRVRYPSMSGKAARRAAIPDFQSIKRKVRCVREALGMRPRPDQRGANSCLSTPSRTAQVSVSGAVFIRVPEGPLPTFSRRVAHSIGSAVAQTCSRRVREKYMGIRVLRR
jgi:hypothetical protein